MLRQKNRNTTGVTIFLENPVSPLKTGLTGLIYYFSVKDRIIYLFLEIGILFLAHFQDVGCSFPIHPTSKDTGVLGWVIN